MESRRKDRFDKDGNLIGREVDHHPWYESNAFWYTVRTLIVLGVLIFVFGMRIGWLIALSQL